MNLTYKDLNGALMLICYDTVSTEHECDTMSHCLSYTIEDGVLIRYELNGDGETLDFMLSFLLQPVLWLYGFSGIIRNVRG